MRFKEEEKAGADRERRAVIRAVKDEAAATVDHEATASAAARAEEVAAAVAAAAQRAAASRAAAWTAAAGTRPPRRHTRAGTSTRGGRSCPAYPRRCRPRGSRDGPECSARGPR